jgi:hypothetical protein
MLPVDRLTAPPPAETVFRIVRRVFHGSQVHHVLRSPSGLELEASTPSSATLEVGIEVVAHTRARGVPIYPIEAEAPQSKSQSPATPEPRP